MEVGEEISLAARLDILVNTLVQEIKHSEKSIV
jgi:hypothetical protein